MDKLLALLTAFGLTPTAIKYLDEFTDGEATINDRVFIQVGSNEFGVYYIACEWIDGGDAVHNSPTRYHAQDVISDLLTLTK